MGLRGYCLKEDDVIDLQKDKVIKGWYNPLPDDRVDVVGVTEDDVFSTPETIRNASYQPRVRKDIQWLLDNQHMKTPK